MTKELSIVVLNGEHRIDSRLVAASLGIDHKHFLETLRIYKADFEDLGVMPFQTAKPPKGTKGGRPERFVQLKGEKSLSSNLYKLACG